MNKLTQEDMIKIYLEENGEITPLDAYREFGILRLSARILNLRNQGYDIKTTRETSKNRYGTPVSYACYQPLKKWYVKYMNCEDKYYQEYILGYDRKEVLEKADKLRKSPTDIILDCYFVSLEWK